MFLYLSLLTFVVVLVIFTALFIGFELYAIVISSLKGAPFVPSNKEKIAAMIKLADIKKGDKIVDLGSGSGTILFAAAKKGAMAFGAEINLYLVFYSRFKARRLGLTQFIKVDYKDFWEYPLHNADAVFLYLWPSTVKNLKEKLAKELKPGAKIISNSFPIEGWRAAREENGVYLYINR